MEFESDLKEAVENKKDMVLPFKKRLQSLETH